MSKGLALPSRSDVKARSGRQAVPRGRAVLPRLGVPEFRATYTIMNNDLQAVINGTMTTSTDARGRRRIAEG